MYLGCLFGACLPSTFSTVSAGEYRPDLTQLYRHSARCSALPVCASRAQNERKLRTLGELSLELETCVPFILQYGVMPSSAQLLEAGRPDLVQAIKARDSLVIPTQILVIPTCMPPGPWS